MSHSSDDVKIPNNEQIVSEITEKLNSEVSMGDSGQNKEKSENIDSLKINEVEGNSSIQDLESEDVSEQEFNDDFIDEEQLKDLEVNLSELEKEERYSKALELKNKGNEEFVSTRYLESISLYTNALKICPLKYKNDRSILYANRAASKIKLDRKKSAIDDCTQAIELNDKYIKAYLRRAKLYEETEKLDESLADYKKILTLDVSNPEALRATYRLPPLIEERNEKLKTEMLGKLKDLGNMILKPFGLSTENFQLNQDPNSGGYSVNFTENSRK